MWVWRRMWAVVGRTLLARGSNKTNETLAPHSPFYAQHDTNTHSESLTHECRLSDSTPSDRTPRLVLIQYAVQPVVSPIAPY